MGEWGCDQPQPPGSVCQFLAVLLLETTDEEYLKEGSQWDYKTDQDKVEAQRGTFQIQLAAEEAACAQRQKDAHNQALRQVASQTLKP